MLSPDLVSTEFASNDFTDKRLNARFLKVVKNMSEQPQQTISQANAEWAETKGAYRLFSNDSVSREKILAPHISKTMERYRQHELVLIIQDTTHVSFNHRPMTSGLDPIGVTRNLNEVNGLLMHTGFALTPHGEPMWILVQDMWSRIRKSIGKREKETEKNKYASRIKAPEDKESHKWINLGNRYGSDCVGRAFKHRCGSSSTPTHAPLWFETRQIWLASLPYG